MKKLFSHDPATGITRYFHFDPLTNEIAFETVQQTTEIVEANRAQFNATDRRYGKEEFTKVASIPLALFMELKKKGIANDPAALKKWLNDPDNRAFRTKPGIV